MMIYLPEDLETSLRGAVNSGHFPSLEDALAEAVRMLLSREQSHSASMTPHAETDRGLGLIGALRDDADELDQAVEHAMTIRTQSENDTNCMPPDRELLC